jgi:hypothetical protein
VPSLRWPAWRRCCCRASDPTRRSVRTGRPATPSGLATRARGKLTRARSGFLWDDRGGYVPYAPKNGVAVIQFQPVNGQFTDYKTVPIGKGGAVNGGVVAQKDGAWRYRFPGNVSTAPTFQQA